MELIASALQRIEQFMAIPPLPVAERGEIIDGLHQALVINRQCQRMADSGII